MLKRHERCDKCNQLCIEKDNQLLGPLEGKYEYLCRSCSFGGNGLESMKDIPSPKGFLHSDFPQT